MRWRPSPGCFDTAKFLNTSWASVRSLRHHGITSAASVDDTDNLRRNPPRRSPIFKNDATKNVALSLGLSLGFLVLVIPKSSIPVGVVFYQPAPYLSAWYKSNKILQKQGVPAKQRPRKPAPNPQYPTKEQLALRFLASFKAHQPDVRIHAVMADAL
jgi:hypothetical protein